MNRPLALIILDGWGYSSSPDGNAVAMAQTPTMDRLWNSYPHTLLHASGVDVGLPIGQMGNSEVGHLNLGAGRVVYQDIMRISNSISSGAFYDNTVFLQACAQLKKTGGSLHLIGLVSDGGVHSLDTHLFALIELAKRQKVARLYVHAFLDGRDTSPISGRSHIARLQEVFGMQKLGSLATVMGRYYAMDRDKRWDRIEKAYLAMTGEEGDGTNEIADVDGYLERMYTDDITDEFIPPARLLENGLFQGRLSDNDAVIFFNFRGDRARQITRAIMEVDFDPFPRKNLKNLHFVCMTEYNSEFTHPVAFPQIALTNILADLFEQNKISNVRLAETEKYPHVTFFFNGGRERCHDQEERVLIPSPKVATYDLKPEMSALEVLENGIKLIESKKFIVHIVNFANADMVGHTGKLKEAIKAIETVDLCLGRYLDALAKEDGRAVVLADHGNAEKMFADDGSPFTAHTCNPVPCIYFDQHFSGTLRSDQALKDVAPTILAILNIPTPLEMEGQDLRIRTK